MPNMKNIDVDAFVNKARELADEHGWCEVVEDALVELGLVEASVYSATFTLSVKVNDITVPSGQDAEKWLKEHFSPYVLLEGGESGYDVIFDDNLGNADVKVEVVKGSTAPEADWWYLSSEGRVQHHVTEHSGGYGGNYFTSKCGEYVTRYGMTKTSPRGENRHCVKCQRKVDNA